MITLKKMEIGDLDQFIHWLKKPHVHDVWISIQSMSDDEIYNKYYKRLNEGEIEMYIILSKNDKIGYIQTYLLNDLSSFRINGLAKGIDLFIGDEKSLGRGFGPAAIRELLVKYVFDDKNILHACIDPEVRNERAIRSYEKVGFEHVHTGIDMTSNVETYYMVLSRDDFFRKNVDK